MVTPRRVIVSYEGLMKKENAKVLIKRTGACKEAAKWRPLLELRN
jgi:hypothetical protein